MNRLLSQYSGLKKEIYILFVGKLVTAMGSFVWPMMTFLLTTKLGLSDGFATFLIAAAGLISLPAALLGGKLADMFSRKKIIIVFDICTVSLYVLAAVLPIGYHTAVIVFFAGLFQTIESPAYDALNSDFSTSQQREKAFSLSYLGYNLGFIVGAAFSGLLFQNHTNLAFLINGVSILVSTVLIWLFVHMKNAVGECGGEEEVYSEYEQPLDGKVSTWTVLRQRKVVLLMMIIGCVSSMPNVLVGILLPLQLKEQMGQAGAEVYGYLNSLNGFVVIVFTPLLTMWMRRITEIPKASGSMLLFSAGMVLFAINGQTWLLYAGMFIYTIGEVISVLGLNPYSSRRIPASHRGRIGGVSSVVYSLFSSVTQFLISGILTVTQSNYGLLWAVFIGIGVVSAGLYAMQYRPDRKMFPKLYRKGESL